MHPVLLKESTELNTPLLLFDCRLTNGDLERWSTHQVSFGGNVYQGRILNQHLFEMRAAVDGADSRGTVSVSLANLDGYISQLDRTVGIKGAKLTIRFVFFDLTAGTATSEPLVVYLGTADPPSEFNESSVRLTFRSRLEFSRMQLPQIRIQTRCPWLFPRTLSERGDASTGGAAGEYSMFFRCGYSADVEGGCGNLNGGEAYTSCDYTVGACRARGMFDRDDRGQNTRRFGGIQYLPVSTVVRSFGDKASHTSDIQENAAKYNDFVPLVYGRALYQPPVIFSRNDGNLTHMEVLLGSGPIQGVIKVIVNDTEIPKGISGNNMTATGWYNTCSLGSRVGDFNQDFRDAAGNTVGDPYGSMAYLSVVVPNRVADGRSSPRIQVMMDGLVLPTFELDGTPAVSAFTQNPAWIVLDILRRLGWSTEELDLASFARAASFCTETIPAVDIQGVPIQVPRFAINLVLRRRRSAAEVHAESVTQPTSYFVSALKGKWS